MHKPVNLKPAYKLTVYLLGLAGTCLGVSICLKSTLGLDAWNAAMAGLSNLTPATFGQWTILIQGSFWLISSLIDKKARLLSILPILYKGIVLDAVQPLIEKISFGGSLISDVLLFAAGYVIIGFATGVYISTGYPRMPIDGLMLSLANAFHCDIKWSRLIIEITGFATMIAVHGAFGIGTVIITFTCGYMFSACRRFSERTIMKEMV